MEHQVKVDRYVTHVLRYLFSLSSQCNILLYVAYLPSLCYVGKAGVPGLTSSSSSSEDEKDKEKKKRKKTCVCSGEIEIPNLSEENDLDEIDVCDLSVC